MNHFEYSLETAHPNAHALMKEDFFWSPIEESSPFGSDDVQTRLMGLGNGGMIIQHKVLLSILKSW